MPLDAGTGVYYALHGHGEPLLVGLPLMASHVAIFGERSRATVDGYLERLVDRYRVLLVDYPSIGGSRDILPTDLTADRVCADLLGVADAAGFDRFAYWGYSWSGAVGLQLALRTDRLTALVVGGWPPLHAPYASLLDAVHRKAADPEPSSMVVLRDKAQYRQWATFYESLAGWDESTVARIACPRLALFGADGDLVEAGIPVPIASTMRAQRGALERLGWEVVEIEGKGHALCIEPDIAVPPVRAFLDRVVEAAER